jgi:hypothetical protein
VAEQAGQAIQLHVPAPSPACAASTHSGCSSCAMNMTGTPYSEVQRSPATAASVARASKHSAAAQTSLSHAARWDGAPQEPVPAAAAPLRCRTCWVDRCGAVREAGQVAHHNTEAVVEGHRDAHPAAQHVSAP